LDYIENHEWPDINLNFITVYAAMFTWFGISWFLFRYHEFNTMSCKLFYNTIVRHEVYALRDSSGYNKFRDKMFRYHKNRGMFKGEFS